MNESMLDFDLLFRIENSESLFYISNRHDICNTFDYKRLFSEIVGVFHLRYASGHWSLLNWRDIHIIRFINAAVSQFLELCS